MLGPKTLSHPRTWDHRNKSSPLLVKFRWMSFSLIKVKGCLHFHALNLDCFYVGNHVLIVHNKYIVIRYNGVDPSRREHSKCTCTPWIIWASLSLLCLVDEQAQRSTSWHPFRGSPCFLFLISFGKASKKEKRKKKKKIYQNEKT